MSKWYITLFFCVLIVFAYMNNKAIANSPAPLDQGSDPENPLLCRDPEEIRKAAELMNEAVIHLQYHATSTENYILISNYNNGRSVYFKNHGGHTIIEKLNNKISDSNKYNTIIKEICDLNRIKIVDGNALTGKVVRVYSPNLVMVQQRCRNLFELPQKYFYALAEKFEISENTTVIVCASANINDHNRSDKKFYKNTILESANLFKTEVNSEIDIRSGELKKLFINLLGFFIKKEDEHVDLTCVSSIYDVSNAKNPFTKMCRA
ncbi:fam-a protein [Plasmodium berghei]|uniref:Fam-a protein n=1 Tax=Plasmodium berghei TaxID=5821 RepID=A0A1C6W7Q3_PLABE|nr:fam-a protein [Plasmodium berghei]